jgi:DNA-binding winged helix-turn-helix (wHTH) protein/TolB-like protein
LDDALLQFGPFSLRIDGTLFRHAELVRLPPKELALLRVLVGSPGQVVPLEVLRKNAWNGIHVSDESLPRCISSLRAHLGIENCIQTVYKRGYRLQLPVNRILASTGAGSPAEPFRGRESERWIERDLRPVKLAILPLLALRGVPQALGQNVAEALMLRMVRVANRAVELIAWNSVIHLADRGLAARDIGLALGADAVLAGTVAALPRHLRVRTELIQVSNHIQLWLEDFLFTRDADLSVEDQVVGVQAADRIAPGIETRLGMIVLADTLSNKILERSSSGNSAA